MSCGRSPKVSQGYNLGRLGTSLPQANWNSKSPAGDHTGTSAVISSSTKMSEIFLVGIP